VTIIRTRRGLDVRIGGAPVQSIEPGPSISSVAVLGADYVGLRPRMMVDVGDVVRSGQALVSDRDDPSVTIPASAAGRIAAVNRGKRRALESIVIEIGETPPDSAISFDALPATALAQLDRNVVTARLLASGLWASLRTRPYSRIPHSQSTPSAIFVTAIDTRPHAPDPAIVIARDPLAFGAGLDLVERLTDGIVHVCTHIDANLRVGESERRRHCRFGGPHPAGLPGTHIHMLHPAGHDTTVWHIGYQDVIAIGKLFLNGHPDFSRVVALSGPGVERPRLVETRLGAATRDLAGPADGCRVVSGSLLDGRNARGSSAYLGRYHLQVSVIPEARDRRVFGWLRRGIPDTTAQHGEPCAMIPGEQFDAAMPLDLLANPLLRSLLAGDAREAARLGCLELDEEDLALMAWLCPAKIDYAAALRANLDKIWKER